MRRSETGGWTVGNLVTCHLPHVCPVCAYRRAQDVRAQVGAAIELQLRGERRPAYAPDVWMLTLTVPHEADDDPRALVHGLVRAWALFADSRTWERFRRRWGVHSVLRVFDATWGGNGLHPHFHVGLFVDSAAVAYDEKLCRWSASDRAAYLRDLARDELAEAWTLAVQRAGIHVPSLAAHYEIGTELTGAEAAAGYFCKWGMADELAMGAVKSSNQWNLLDDYGAGDAVAGELFREFYEATKGLAVVTGLRRLRDALAITDDDVADYVARERAARDLHGDGARVEPIEVRIPAWLHPPCIAVGWPVLQEVAELAGADGAQRAVEEYLLRHNVRTAPASLREYGPDG